MSDRPVATDSIDVASPPKPSFLARLLGRLRRSPAAAQSPDTLTTADAPAVRPGFIGRLLASLRRQPDAEGEPHAASGEEASTRTGGFMAFVRAQVLLIVILTGVVLLGVVITLVVMVVAKQRKTPPNATVTAHSVPTKPAIKAPPAPNKQPDVMRSAKPEEAKPPESGDAVHISPQAEANQLPSSAPADPLAEARKQLEQERAQLAAEKQALDAARKAFEAQQGAKGKSAAPATESKPAFAGDCSLEGSDPAAIRESLRNCLGLPSKPADPTKPVDAAKKSTDTDKSVEKATVPKPKTDAH
ncbi:hypothetical protein [Chitinivorax sp. B]|uniref:hypothetical protein n=1 Tax=Chitinivorax sp. B TaxID=2502235 RepID=UPI0010F74EE1|nr:hypothetical protein [Chitinivorax sp. B]